MIWTSVAGHCVSRADRFAENTLYTVVHTITGYYAVFKEVK